MFSLAGRRLLLLVLLALALAGVWRLARREQAIQRVAREIRLVFALETGLSPAARRARENLTEFYRQRHFRPAWTDGEHADDRAYELVRALGRVSRDGLEPEAYGRGELSRTLQTLPFGLGFEKPAHPERLADLDVRLTESFLAVISDLDHGRLPRVAFDPDWVPADTVETLEYAANALRRHQVERAIADLGPHDDAYRALREALIRYRRIAARGGWPKLPPGPELKWGSSGPAVDSLAARLAIEGDFVLEALPPEGPRRFSSAITRAVRTYQARTGLDTTGRLDAATRAALNDPVAERVRQIELNLERRRWVSRNFGDTCLVVNIPEFRLDLRASGRRVLSMRVVVGRRDNPTPVFSDSVVYLEMNPMWRLPRRILVEEILPAWRRDPTYFEKNQMRVLWTGGRKLMEVRPDSIDWTPVEDDTFDFIVRQDSGPENPLGRIKFMCPNEYDVYLHDTPSRQYFQAGARDRSHGCVRVENPLDLAISLLHDSRQGSRDSIVAMVESGNWRRLRLARRVPVHVMYWTAWVDTAGRVQFRDDVYSLDQRLDQALRTHTTDRFVINPAVQWGEKHRETVAPEAVPAVVRRDEGTDRVATASLRRRHSP